MSTETNVQQVKVNLMTQAQYDEVTKNPNEFYVITDQNYITETELESKGYLTSYTETDPVYSADKPNLALKSEIPTKTSQLTNDSDYITSEYHDSTKQNIISDLETIRDGASKGSTALQSVPDEYITETELELKGYLTSYTEIDPVYTADKPNLALKSELPDLAPYATKEELNSGLAGKQEAGNYALKSEIPDISNLATKEELTIGLSDKQDIISDLETIREGASKGATALQSIPSEYVTETELNNKGYLTEHQDISGKQDILTQNAQATGSAISLVSNSNYYTIKPTSATTFTFPSVSAGKVYTFELKVTLSSVYSLTFPSSVVWMNGETPDMSEAGVYFLVFRTDDGGNTWYGNSQGRWSI